MVRIRKTNAAVGTTIFIGILMMIYTAIDTISYEDLDVEKKKLHSLELKLNSLENELSDNQKAIDKIKETIEELGKEKSKSKAVRAKGKSFVNKTFASIHKSDFEFARQKPAQCDIRMADIYDNIPFDNIDGGVWKQGWPITYDASQWTKENKLKVFVMPHSHNDPG